MQRLVVQIVRFVDAHMPGRVACEFVDADGRKHTLIDKTPIFTSHQLDSTSTYPQAGVVRCEVLFRWRDTHGRDLARVTTERPDDVESTEGLSEFVILSRDLLT